MRRRTERSGVEAGLVVIMVTENAEAGGSPVKGLPGDGGLARAL